MIKKLIFLSIFLVLALGLMGGAYAGPWSDQLYINGTLTTRDQPPAGCEGEETAYAYGYEYAHCFGNPWGWYNGEINGCKDYKWPLYAGAGQCDINKGTLVGYLYVSYKNCKWTVTYDMDPGYYLYETHLYISSENPGGFVPPGQCQYKDDDLNGKEVHTYKNISAGDQVYIIAHAVVRGNYPCEDK